MIKKKVFSDPKNPQKTKNKRILFVHSIPEEFLNRYYEMEESLMGSINFSIPGDK